MKRGSQLFFCKETLYKPDYLQDNKNFQSIQNMLRINIDNSSAGFSRNANRKETCRATDEYIPIVDPLKTYELNRMERRYKLNFNHKFNLYSKQYLGEFSSLLGIRNNKDYLIQRKKMIKKYDPNTPLVINKNNQGTFYLTDNQKTIQSHRQNKANLGCPKFHYIPLQKMAIPSLNSSKSKQEYNRSPRLTSENHDYDYKYDKDKETGEFNLIVPRNGKNDDINGTIETENIKEYLKNKFNFFDKISNKGINHYYSKKQLIPDTVVNYYKNNNPSKVEYMKKLMLNKKNLPNVLSHELLPNLQGFYKNNKNYKSQQTFKIVVM